MSANMDYASISRYDVMAAIQFAARDENAGKLATGSMYCAENTVNTHPVDFMVFDPNNYPHQGTITTRILGLVNGTTIFSGLPSSTSAATTSTQSSSTTTTSKTCRFSAFGKCP